MRSRSSGNSETRALEAAFKAFDVDKSGTIEFSEFRTAMERFGLATGGDSAVTGCTVEVILALFDRYDPDASGSISYDEFIKVRRLSGSSYPPKLALKQISTRSQADLKQMRCA